MRKGLNFECRFIEVGINLRFLTPTLKASPDDPVSSVREVLAEIAGRFWVETLHCIQVQVIEQKGSQLKVKFTFAEIRDGDVYWTSRTPDSVLANTIIEGLGSEWRQWSDSDHGGLPQLDQFLVNKIERNPVHSKLFDDYRRWLLAVGNPRRVFKGGRKS